MRMAAVRVTRNSSDKRVCHIVDENARQNEGEIRDKVVRLGGSAADLTGMPGFPRWASVFNRPATEERLVRPTCSHDSDPLGHPTNRKTNIASFVSKRQSTHWTPSGVVQR